MIGAIDNSYASNLIKVNTGRYVDESSAMAKSMKRNGQLECETCSERKYQDGSDENVSYKAATHISPQNAAGAVRAHEQEHISNAYAKASKEGGKVVSASVRIKTSVCPECGRGYVSGGLTTTQIKYSEDNPYGKNAKSAQAESLSGNNVDYKV